MKKNKLFNGAIATTTLASLLTTGLADTAFANDNSSNNSNAAGIVVSIEAPRIQQTQLPNANEYYTVDFDNQSSGTSGFSKINGTTTYEYSSDLEIKAANQWGGAEGSKFITQEQSQSIRSYKINVDEDQKYFGFWWSAGDPYNKITFKKNGEQVAEFKTKDLVDFIQGSGVSNTSEYYGNPAYNGNETGHENEPFSYVNIFFKQGSYDEIVVATVTEGSSAFESDNHTFSAIEQDVIGTPLPGSTPAAIDDLITTDEDTSKTLNVIDNDINPNNDLEINKITVDGVEQSIGSSITLASGALLTVEDNGQATYDPNGQFESFSPGDSETDTFTYTVIDGNGNSSTADVTMKINGVADAPLAVDDIRNIDEDTIKEIPVLQNDEDPDTAKENLAVTAINNTPVTVGSIVKLPSGATVKLVAVPAGNQRQLGQHALEYNPTSSNSLQALNDGDSEIETFSYTAEDPDGKTGSAQVKITVEGITDYPAD